MAEQKNDASSPSLRVRYFGAQGRAHPVRLALTLGGIAFIDEFVEGPEHAAAKAKGDRRWSGLPEIVVYDAEGKEVTVIGQSLAMLRYAGTLAGLYPSIALDRARVDEIMDALGDAAGTIREPNKDKQKEKREAAMAKDGALTYMLKKFELRLEENEKRGNKNGYFVGDSLTIADLAVSGTCGTLVSGYFDHIPKDLFSKNHPKLAAFLEMMSKNEKIKAFNEKFAARQADYRDESKKKDAKVVTYPGKQISIKD